VNTLNISANERMLRDCKKMKRKKKKLPRVFFLVKTNAVKFLLFCSVVLPDQSYSSFVRARISSPPYCTTLEGVRAWSIFFAVASTCFTIAFTSKQSCDRKVDVDSSNTTNKSQREKFTVRILEKSSTKVIINHQLLKSTNRRNLDITPFKPT
jgi:hypothetical protein